MALRADLLACVADRRAAEWGPCEYTTQAREIADEAQAIAANANRLVNLNQRPAGGPD